MRTPVTSISGQGMRDALERVAEVRVLKTGEVDLARIPPVKLAELGRHTVRPDVTRREWDAILRVAGSLTTGKGRAYDLIRMMSADGRHTSLGEAFAHYGRIFKTLHVLQFLHDES